MPSPEIGIAIMRLPHGAGLPLPAYATAHAAGMDVVAAEALTLAPGARHAVATGFAIAIPEGHEVQVRPRSGLALKHGVTCLNTPGTIDADYRGEVKVILANLGTESFAIARGDRIAQLVPAAVQRARFDEVDTLDETVRGARGVRLDRAMTLTDEELERYARHIVLPQVGGAGQALLRNARITVIGAGGIGCPAIQYLAAAGVGVLTIVDDDHVSLANLQRQTLFTTTDIGAPKAARAAAAVAALNPHVDVTAVPQRIVAENVADLIQDTDLVLDGCDNFATRLIVSDHCTRARIPLVSAAIAQFHGQLGVFRGWEADQPCYRCFVGDAHDPDDCDSCAEQGVLGAMAGMMGSFAAMEAIRIVTRFGPDIAGQLHLLEGLAPAMRTIRLPKDPGCRTCGAMPN